MAHLSRTILASLLLAALAPCALHAGGTKADYARAAAMPGSVRGKVLNERLRGTWADEHTFTYRQQLTPTTWRFVQVDGREGGREEAFDHAAVAQVLGTKLGRELDPAALPLRIVGREGKALLASAAGRAFALDGGGGVREVDLASNPALGMEPRQVDRSRGGGEDTAIVFVNRSEQPVQLVWLSHDGSRRTYATVAPGATHRQHTFPGHAWLVLGKDGKDLGRYVGRRRPGVVFITGAPAQPPARQGPRRPRGMSPNGKLRALIQDGQVVLKTVATGRTRPLSDDGTSADPYTRRMSWSPDSRWLMVVREAPAQEHFVHVVESAPKDGVEPKLHRYGYLKPGDRIARPRPRLFDVRARRLVTIPEDAFATPWSISRFSWSPDGKRFRFLYNQRGHQVLRFLELDPAKGTVRTLIEETSPTFVDYSQKLVLRQVGKTDTWLWASERSGWNHLYTLDAGSGTLEPLTSGAWLVREVVGVDADAGTVHFTALGVHANQDPYHRHHGRIPLAGGAVTWLTEGDGTHDLEPSPDGAYFVDTWSRADQAPVHELRRADGTLVTVLEQADAAPLLATGWQLPERFHAKGRDGTTDIWGVIYKPSTFDPKARYPVIETIYAGPHGQFVPKSFQAWRGARALAEIGFVVVQIDGMGTNWRHRAFHDVCWKNLGDSGFPDRIPWMRAAAATRPWMDLERVGIVGGSAGGQSALRALLAHGDFYDTAVADCGCHDNRMDKIWWNEAWMGWPVGPHYAEQSNVTQAHRLQGKLLLIVGELDRNVDPASTMQVADALVKADKDFDLLVIPGAGHGAMGTPYGTRRMRDFFVRHLLGSEPRAP